MQETLRGVTKQNVKECIVNELKCCVKKKKVWNDWKNHHDASFYPVDDSTILAFPATHASNFLDGQELGTRNGRRQAGPRIVNWLPLEKIIVTTS